MTQKIYHLEFINLIKFFVIIKIFFFLNTFEIALQFLFKVFIVFNIVFNLKINLKLKIDQKMSAFKILEEIWQTWKKFRKNEWQP